MHAPPTLTLAALTVLLSGALVASPALAQEDELDVETYEETPSTAGRAEPGGAGSIGVGVILGEPLAIGGRYWMTSEIAVQGWLGTTLIRGGAYLGADALYCFREAFRTTDDKIGFDLWVGGGVALGTAKGERGLHFHDDPWPYWHNHDDPAHFLLLARVPGGISMMLTQVPLELFLEAAVGMRFTPNAGAFAAGGLGGRWYF